MYLELSEDLALQEVRDLSPDSAMNDLQRLFDRLK